MLLINYQKSTFVGILYIHEFIVLGYFLFSLFLYILNLKKEAVYSFETSVTVYESTPCITF
jgi:hypothetical protein